MKTLYLALLVSCVSISALTACNKAPDASEQSTSNAESEHNHDEHAEHQHDGHEHTAEAQANVAEAEIIEQGDFTIVTPFAKAPIPGQKNSSAYFTLKNNGSEEVMVTGVKSDVSAVTEFHTMKMQDGKMIMRPMEEVKIAAGGELVLSLGANHVMLIDLQKTLVAGDVVNLTLDLSNGEKLAIAAKVQTIQ